MSTENERMATVEGELKQINTLLTKLDKKFDDMNTQYVPRAEIDEKFRNRDEKILNMQAEIIAMKSAQQSNRTLYPAWAAVIVALIAVVVAIFF